MQFDRIFAEEESEKSSSIDRIEHLEKVSSRQKLETFGQGCRDPEHEKLSRRKQKGLLVHTATLPFINQFVVVCIQTWRSRTYSGTLHLLPDRNSTAVTTGVPIGSFLES